MFKDQNIHPCPNAPCLFSGIPKNAKSRIYIGLYVDDFIYFAEDDATQHQFETNLAKSTLVSFQNHPKLFLGIRLTKKTLPQNKFSIHLSQEVIIDSLKSEHNLSNSCIPKPTPYRSGLPVDKVPPTPNLPHAVQRQTEDTLRSLVGSFNWLAISTRPDIATITNLLAQYLHRASPGHVASAKHVLRYLIGTSNLGIEFSPLPNPNTEAYVHFPLGAKPVALTDANWGPQDQSHPDPNNPEQLDLFKSRSISGFIIFMGGPLHWVSKRQSITARSSAEAEIYAVDECVKALQHIRHIFEDLHLDSLLPTTFPIFNDNDATVKWTSNLTTKGLRHIQMRENSTREQQQNGFCKVKHIAGNRNLSDILTKEEKNASHYIDMRDATMSPISHRIMISYPLLNFFSYTPH